MAKYIFEAGKRLEDCVKRLDFNGNTYRIHYQRTADGLESVEQIFPCQVPNFHQLPERVRQALEQLHDGANEFVIARAVQTLTDYERGTTNEAH
jgi:hypothetical protein